MKKVFQKILPTSKDSAAARLRRNNAPVTDDVDRRGQSTAVEITDSEDDGRSSDGDISSHTQSRAGEGGGGVQYGVARAESFEELTQEYSHYERQATADDKYRAGRNGASGKAAMAAADPEESSSDGGAPRGQVAARTLLYGARPRSAVAHSPGHLPLPSSSSAQPLTAAPRGSSSAGTTRAGRICAPHHPAAANWARAPSATAAASPQPPRCARHARGVRALVHGHLMEHRVELCHENSV
jgi:hypothetical protein